MRSRSRRVTALGSLRIPALLKLSLRCEMPRGIQNILYKSFSRKCERSVLIFVIKHNRRAFTVSRTINYDRNPKRRAQVRAERVFGDLEHDTICAESRLALEQIALLSNHYTHILIGRRNVMPYNYVIRG